MRIRQIAISLVSVFAMAVSTTVGFASTSVSAATVTSGVCTATVGNATGVTMTVVEGECVLKFTNVGTTTWTVPSGVTTVRVLVVGAGGGGGADAGGGGGGGQVVDSSTTAVSGEVTISVGAGGTAGLASGHYKQWWSHGVIQFIRIKWWHSDCQRWKRSNRPLWC
jgi:hypothetical protein